MGEDIQEVALEEQWVKAEWCGPSPLAFPKSFRFKLRLRNKIGTEKSVGNDIPPPFTQKHLRCLFRLSQLSILMTESYIEETSTVLPSGNRSKLRLILFFHVQTGGRVRNSRR